MRKGKKNQRRRKNLVSRSLEPEVEERKSNRSDWLNRKSDLWTVETSLELEKKRKANLDKEHLQILLKTVIRCSTAFI